MKVKTPQTGGVCQSVQGRDKGRYYIIKSVNADGSVMVCDGNFKRLASPKRKSVKHLRLLPDVAEGISAKLCEGKQVFDTEIYSALKTYNIGQTAEPPLSGADGGEKEKRQ